MTRRRQLTCLISISGVLAASVIFADEAVVKTRDGYSYQGEVVERGSNLFITLHGVETVIPKDDVASVEPMGDFEVAFRASIARLDTHDVAGRITLAREAFGRRRYDLARDGLESALAIDPNAREASELLDLIQSQIRLERAKAENPPPGPTSRGTVAQAGIDRRFLTVADIEAIRRKELKPTDFGVRIRFEGDVKKRFADSQNVSFAEFAAFPPVQQALLIYDRGDDSMRQKVHVLSDPSAIIDYRRYIQPLIVQNCATIGCHGGPGGAGFIMYSNAENDAATYTNFYILQQYARKSAQPAGVFDGAMKRMIDRGRGEASILANYGLPYNVAELDHPQVNGRPLQPVFRNKDDVRYRMVVDWMNVSLLPNAPDYGIVYSPPGAPPPAQQQPKPNQ